MGYGRKDRENSRVAKPAFLLLPVNYVVCMCWKSAFRQIITEILFHHYRYAIWDNCDMGILPFFLQCPV